MTDLTEPLESLAKLIDRLSSTIKEQEETSIQAKAKIDKVEQQNFEMHEVIAIFERAIDEVVPNCENLSELKIEDFLQLKEKINLFIQTKMPEKLWQYLERR